MTVAVSVGRYGGFYVYCRRNGFRLCLGWVALTAIRHDLDDVLQAGLNALDAQRKEKNHP